MKKYETVMICRQDISPSQVDSLTATFSKIITDNKGQVVHTEYCGLKPLAYRIRKNRKAHYVLLDLIAPAGALQEMERIMKINEDVIRFMTVQVDEHGPRPSALMQSRYNREEGHRYHSAREEGVSGETETAAEDDLPEPAIA